MKNSRLTLRKSSRKSHRKHPRKSYRKASRKSSRKSNRKKPRKSNRKSNLKKTRKSSQKSSRANIYGGMDDIKTDNTQATGSISWNQALNKVYPHKKYVPDRPTDRSLPEGWTTWYSIAQPENTYYLNTLSGETQLSVPTEPARERRG